MKNSRASYEQQPEVHMNMFIEILANRLHYQWY